MAKVTGSLQKSTEIMKLSNNLVKLPQLSATMREMSMEMTKVCRARSIYVIVLTRRYQAGIMEEMLDDIVDVEEDEDIEEEANEEVDKVLFDLTDGKLGQAGSVGELPVSVLRELPCPLKLTHVPRHWRHRYKKQMWTRRWRDTASVSTVF